jgi:hypothetical protein
MSWISGQFPGGANSALIKARREDARRRASPRFAARI